jgi:Domain of unknown function (DUF4375)
VFAAWLGGALISMIDNSNSESPIDLRAEVTRSELKAFLADPDIDIWQLAFWDNAKLNEFKQWNVAGTEHFEMLTQGQQLLVLVGSADGEIGNGGIGQLFFNRGGSVPAMQVAFEEMGCKFAAGLLGREIDRLSQTNFIAKWIDAKQRFTSSSSSGEKEQTWKEFTNLIDEFFPQEKGNRLNPIDQAYLERREETMDCAKNYVGAHQDEYFVFKD